MNNPKKGKQANNPLIIWAVICGISTPFLAHYFPKVMVVIISMGLAALVASLISSWYVKRGKFEKQVLLVLFWSNLIAWIIPDLGFLIGYLSIQLNAQNHGKDRRIFMMLGLIGLVLSILHFSLRLAHMVNW